jgi:hypothetical protein
MVDVIQRLVTEVFGCCKAGQATPTTCYACTLLLLLLLLRCRRLRRRLLRLRLAVPLLRRDLL